MEHGERAYPPSAYVDGWDDDEDEDKHEEARTGEAALDAAGDGEPVEFTSVVTVDSVPASQSNRNLKDNVSDGCALGLTSVLTMFTTQGNPPANGLEEPKSNGVAADGTGGGF